MTRRLDAQLPGGVKLGVGCRGHDLALEAPHLAVQLVQDIGRVGELECVRAQSAMHAAHDRTSPEPAR